MIAVLLLGGLLACGAGGSGSLPSAWSGVAAKVPAGASVTSDDGRKLVLDYGAERKDQARGVGQAWVEALTAAGWSMSDPRPMGPAIGWKGTRGDERLSLFAAPSKGTLTVTLLRD